MRNGKRPHPTIDAKSKGFGEKVSYSDGLSLRIEKIKHGNESGYGRGVFHGSPATQLSVTVTNHTKKSINLNQVVVQLVYGSPAQVAPPVYDDAASDFSGILKSGKSQTSTYVFSIPKVDFARAKMTVDMDAVHSAATFIGSVNN